MKTLIRNILIGMILGQSFFTAAQASLLPMQEKLNFAQIALRDHLESQGLQLIKVDIKAPVASASMIDAVVDKVTALYSGGEKMTWEYVRFKARDLSTEKVYLGWVYLQSQNVTAMKDADIKNKWADAGYTQSYTQVVENGDGKKIWVFLSDDNTTLKPMPRFGDNDLHLVEAQ